MILLKSSSMTFHLKQLREQTVHGGAWTELSTGRINSKTQSGGYTLEQTIVCSLRGVGEKDWI